jgi:hypothetical protein
MAVNAGSMVGSDGETEKRLGRTGISPRSLGRGRGSWRKTSDTEIVDDMSAAGVKEEDRAGH